MQSLEPNKNGMYANGCRLCTSSGKNRSGSNFNGSGQYFSSR